MGKGKKKGTNATIVGTTVIGKTREFEDLLESIGAEGLKERVAGATRETLDKWVTELAGKPSNPAQPNDFVAASLGRWIDGVKNWGDPPPPQIVNGNKNTPEDATPHTQAETPSKEEDEMKKGSTATAAKKNGKKTITPKSVPPGKEKVKTEKKAGTLPVGKTTKKTRAAFILDLLIQNRKDKLSDAALLVKAQKEFGEDLVPGPSGTFTIAHQRGVANKDRVLGRRGLKKTEAEFVEYDKPSADKK